MLFEQAERNILDRHFNPFRFFECAHQIKIGDVNGGVTGVIVMISAIGNNRIPMYFNEGNVGHRRGRWAVVGALSIAAEGPANPLCFGAVLVELFFNLGIVVRRVLALVGRLLVLVNRD